MAFNDIETKKYENISVKKLFQTTFKKLDLTQVLEMKSIFPLKFIVNQLKYLKYVQIT